MSAERIIKASDAITTYFCDAFHVEWDELDSGTKIGPTRTRPPKTHKDKST